VSDDDHGAADALNAEVRSLLGEGSYGEIFASLRAAAVASRHMAALERFRGWLNCVLCPCCHQTVEPPDLSAETHFYGHFYWHAACLERVEREQRQDVP
jgi:hypothetical protein